MQVPGEEQIRWLAIAKINRKNGMLFEILEKPQYTELRQEVVTSINRDGSYNTVDATTFDGKIW